jgi:uncharacterized protein
MAGISEAHRLYQLQTIDIEIEQIEKKKADVEAQMGESEELVQARTALEDARTKLHHEESRARDLELDVQTTAEKLKLVQSKLYGGTVKASKELSALQRESEILQQSKSRSEDDLLERMASMESLQTQTQEAQHTWADAEASWKAQQSTFAAQHKEIEAQIVTMTAKRASIASGFGAEVIGEYERLRAIKRGRAVARVERNTCMGCRIGLPMSVVQQARSSPSFVLCPSCGRILCLER